MAGAQLTASMATVGSDQKKKERREGEGELVTEDDFRAREVMTWSFPSGTKKRGELKKKGKKCRGGPKIPLNLVHNFN